MDQTDAQLIERLNRGDASAFAALFDRHREWTHRIARRFAETDADAAEITQEVFMRWLRQFPGFRVQAKVTTYLYAAARNIALDRRRKDRRLSFGAEVAENSQPMIRTPDKADLREQAAKLRESLAKLPDGHREVLLMRIVDGMSVEDVGVALGVAEGTVKSRLARAVEMLRGHMGQTEEDGAAN